MRRLGPAATALVCTCIAAAGAVATTTSGFSPAPTVVPVGNSPYAVAYSPNGKLVASADYLAGDISMIALGAAPAAPSAVSGSPFATGKGPDALSFSPSGGLLAVTNLADATIAVFAVDSSSGALTQVTGSPFPTGNSPRSVAFSPDGKLLAAASAADGTVSVYAVDPSGVLTPVQGSPFPTGTDPLSVAFSPSGNLLATANAGTGTVSVFTVTPGSGALTQVAGSPVAAGNETYSVAFSPDGALLAAANAADSTVSVYAVASSTGTLTPAPGSPFATGKEPLAVGFGNGNGHLLLATANYRSGDVTAFTADPSSGALTPVAGSPLPSGNEPHGIAFAPGPAGGSFAVANAGDSTLALFSPAPPSASISQPTAGGTYTLGQNVPSSFTCSDSSFGPGIASCSDGTSTNGSSVVDTTTPGHHTYIVTATSKDGETGTASIGYSVANGPPVNRARPSISGTPRRGATLSCSPGKWLGGPSFRYQWLRGATAIAGATGTSHAVTTLDEGSPLTCRVTASNNVGNAATASAKPVTIALPRVRGCPAPTGAIRPNRLGPLVLGETTRQARRALPGSRAVRAGNRLTFCLTPAGLRAGLRAGRVAWAATGNPLYGYRGVAVGEAIADARRRLPHGSTYFVPTGSKYGAEVYIVRRGALALLLYAPDGVITELAVVKRVLTLDARSREALARALA